MRRFQESSREVPEVLRSLASRKHQWGGSSPQFNAVRKFPAMNWRKFCLWSWWHSGLFLGHPSGCGVAVCGASWREWPPLECLLSAWSGWVRASGTIWAPSSCSSKSHLDWCFSQSASASPDSWVHFQSFVRCRELPAGLLDPSLFKLPPAPSEPAQGPQGPGRSRWPHNSQAQSCLVASSF